MKAAAARKNGDCPAWPPSYVRANVRDTSPFKKITTVAGSIRAPNFMLSTVVSTTSSSSIIFIIFEPRQSLITLPTLLIISLN